MKPEEIVVGGVYEGGNLDVRRILHIMIRPTKSLSQVVYSESGNQRLTYLVKFAEWAVKRIDEVKA